MRPVKPMVKDSAGLYWVENDRERRHYGHAHYLKVGVDCNGYIAISTFARHYSDNRYAGLGFSDKPVFSAVHLSPEASQQTVTDTISEYWGRLVAHSEEEQAKLNGAKNKLANALKQLSY